MTTVIAVLMSCSRRRSPRRVHPHDEGALVSTPERRILVVNCNTNAEMTRAIGATAQSAALPSTRITALTPPFGPESAEGYYESFVAAAGMLAAVEQEPEHFDAIVLAGFGEHGREGMRQRWDVPVVDITEAGPQLAQLVAHRYGIVTTLDSTLPLIWESLRGAGLDARCTDVVAGDIPVSGIHSSVRAAAAALERCSRDLLRRGAEAIVLGCAGFAGLDAELQDRLGVPVVDPVAAAVRMAEVLCRSGLQTSRHGAYRPVNEDKTWKMWPPHEYQTAQDPRGEA
ncbi:aspartate/glutamate racemase family protein [Microbacterium sp. gxy059]|uniref:aspartate/glutamate racemase family protein n=1 Tax=Microbacterium sp. gxy059 TaxID=2957199 RepID=UPI003D952297